jgi:hypothetical protein
MHLTTQNRVYYRSSLYQSIRYLLGQLLAVYSVELYMLHFGSIRFRTISSLASAVVSSPPRASIRAS